MKMYGTFIAQADNKPNSVSDAKQLMAIIYLGPTLPSGSSELPFHENSKMNPRISGLLLLPGKNLAVSPRHITISYIADSSLFASLPT